MVTLCTLDLTFKIYKKEHWMKKALSLLALSSLLCTTAVIADEEMESTAEQTEKGENFRHHEEKVYLVAKGLMTSGDTIKEEDATLKGKNGRGFGVDLGYRTGYGINLEVDYAYTKLDITEGKEDVTGDYHSFSFDALYAYHINEPLALFAKGGIEYEIEKINDLDVDKTNTGFIYGAGLEYEIKENMAFIFEYENSTIDGPKGYTLAAGLVVGLNLLD